jgi:hypothetical protein
MPYSAKTLRLNICLCIAEDLTNKKAGDLAFKISGENDAAEYLHVDQRYTSDRDFFESSIRILILQSNL